LYQYEFDALVSLAFNVGHISKVAPNLCKKINACDYLGAPSEFLDMENQKRRRSEYNTFCNCAYDASH
jgi:GH24 family phage-related lysozyme (muramidase)